MVKKQRNEYIDVLKGLLITLVVIGHLPFFEYDSRTLTLIYSFHMPAFLIIGGILSHINETSTFSGILYKRFKSILVPYFIFYLISLIIVPASTYEGKINAIIYMFNGIGNPDFAVNLPLWFLTFYFTTLTIFELIECLFYKLKVFLFGKKTNFGNNHIVFVEIFTFITISIIMYIAYYYARVLKGTRLPFNFEISMFCLGFICFGKLIGLLIPNTITFLKKNTAIAVFSLICAVFFIAIFFFFWYVLSMRNGRIDLNARDYKDSFYMYFDAIIGFILFSVFAFIVSCIPVIKNILAYFGKNSMYILAYHVPSTIITYNIIVPLLPVTFGVAISTCSIYSIMILTLLGISISLFFGLIHKACHLPS